jgi:aminopeptidase N
MARNANNRSGALTFEQTASIARAPSALDDQSAAYQSIVYYKGSMIFRMLRETIGKENFDRLLYTFLETYKGKNASIDEFEKLASKISQRESALLLRAMGGRNWCARIYR